MPQPIYQVDAFTNAVFFGNPAAVCPLKAWLDDVTLQRIAMENNLAETAFYVKHEEAYEIRWFTPTIEVDLCGHATLAAAFVLFNYEGHQENTIRFTSKHSGELSVTRRGEWLTLNFPTDRIEEIEIPGQIGKCFNLQPQLAFRGKTDYVLLYSNEEDIINLTPIFTEISKLKVRGVIVTARGNKTDFVSRFFAPQSGVDEDHVTGSAHTTLIPLWSERLDKIELTATQLSGRRGYLRCKYLNDRVEISGQCKLYLIGEIYLE